MAGQTTKAAKIFRKSFTFVSKDLTYYFPGHMSRGMNQMQNRLKNVDCILEVHDGRIPFSGRNPHFRKITELRPHILILNKIDLADLRHKDRVEARLREEEGITKVMYTNCKDLVHHTIRRRMIPTITEMVQEESRFNRNEKDEYNLLVIGVPNVGKSSLINAMRRTHLKKGKATLVGAIAGVTGSVLERIKISEDPKIFVYDTPGILSHHVKSVDVGMKLALCATMKDHLVGEDVIADYMLFMLNKQKSFKYVRYFGLPEPTDNILEFLAHVAKQHNLILKQRSTAGGYVYRPHFTQAAQIVLRAFRDGSLGKVQLDSDLIAKEHHILEESTGTADHILGST